MAGEENHHISAAKLAEKCERYEDMVKSMKQYMAELGSGSLRLGVDERNLFSMAFKNVVGSKRGALRYLYSQKEKPVLAGTEDFRKVQKEMFVEVLDELKATCLECVQVIEKDVEPFLGREDKQMAEAKDDDQNESKVFFLKMKGDYYRYMAEYVEGEDRDKYKNTSEKHYEEATELAKKLSHYHPIRLGLALNYSVFKYEVLNDTTSACKLAKDAFDKASENFDSDPDNTKFTDSALIMQLLRDNLTLWTNQDEFEDPPEEEES